MATVEHLKHSIGLSPAQGSESDSEETSTTRRSALRSAVEVPSRSGSAVEEKQMCWIVLGDHLQEVRNSHPAHPMAFEFTSPEEEM